jgi:hypothetical protein
MAGVDGRDFSKPDEVRTPEKIRIDVLKMAGGEVGRYTFQPGWRWSDDIKPIVKTDSCQVHHVGYVISGHFHVKHNDGTEQVMSAGMVYNIEPGHDGWNDSAEPCVVVEFQGAEFFAKR